MTSDELYKIISNINIVEYNKETFVSIDTSIVNVRDCHGHTISTYEKSKEIKLIKEGGTKWKN